MKFSEGDEVVWEEDGSVGTVTDVCEKDRGYYVRFGPGDHPFLPEYELREPERIALSHSHTACRVCGSTDLAEYLNLGYMPLPNAFRTVEDLDKPEFREECAVQVCRDCGLSQLTKVVQPERMFDHYLYRSSVSQTFREHCGELARSAAALVSAQPDDLIIDIASNDGCLLTQFHYLGFKNLFGVDPATNLAEQAEGIGIPTLNTYWNRDASRPFAGRAKIITAQNVIAHVDDVHSFVEGVAVALAHDGVFIVECPYVGDLIARTEFDTIYHEHLSYFGVGPLSRLMARHGLTLNEVQYFPNLHGGSIRAYISHKEAIGLSVRAFHQKEAWLTEPDEYAPFRHRVECNRRKLRVMLFAKRASGYIVWAYGASAKGVTLLNSLGPYGGPAQAGSGDQLLDAVIDDTPDKQGLYLPGIPVQIIGGVSWLANVHPEYLLLTAWNFADEMQAKARAHGYEGRFIVPVPEVKVVE